MLFLNILETCYFEIINYRNSRGEGVLGSVPPACPRGGISQICGGVVTTGHGSHCS